MTTTDLLARRAALLGPNVPTFYDTPLHIVRGEGVWLWDAAGNRYLDCYNNVPHVGHCHPKVVEAICRQAATLNTHTRYLHEGILDYAERLVATLGHDLRQVIRFDVTPNWVTQNWSRVSTGLPYLHLHGHRVPLVTGTAEDPVVSLFSRPAMPDRDILGYMLMGRAMRSDSVDSDMLMMGVGTLLPSYGEGFSALGITEVDIQGLFAGLGGIKLRRQFAERWELESTLGVESGVDLYYIFNFE